MDIKALSNLKFGVIGCGKMASAIINGVIKSGFLTKNNIYAYDVNPDASKALGVVALNSIQELLEEVDTLLIATKPFVVNDVLNELKKNYNNQLILSILAGVKIEKYLSIIPEINVVRIMPNTPALVNLGMSAICPCDKASDDDIEFALNLMKNCGEVIKTTEDKMDIITALSGSGPAYYYKFIELMAISAHKLGLDYRQALLLSAQTALGSAKMVIDNNFDINQLIKNVTTPGGCTEVGNNVLNHSNIDKIIDKTILDTMQKAIELG